MFRPILPVALFLTAAAVLAAAPAAEGDHTSHGVAVINFDFLDAETGLRISVVHAGDTLTWSFDQGVHTATSIAGGATFDSGVKRPTDLDPTYSVTFTDPGTIAYWCEVHATRMQGVIHVLA